MKERLPVKEIVLMDIDQARLYVMLGFCKGYASQLQLPVSISAAADSRDAIEGVAFINVEIRVGGNKARILDENVWDAIHDASLFFSILGSLIM